MKRHSLTTATAAGFWTLAAFSCGGELDLTGQPPRDTIPSGFLPVDVERQGDRRDDPKGVAFNPREERRLKPFLEVLVRVV